MRSIGQNQIVLETAKLKKLEKQAHHWMNQELPNHNTLDKICLRMKILLDTAEEKTQILGIDMINITDLPIQEKMSILSSITTLIIDIQNALCNWTKFQDQLAITAKAIVEICV